MYTDAVLHAGSCPRIGVCNGAFGPAPRNANTADMPEAPNPRPPPPNTATCRDESMRLVHHWRSRHRLQRRLALDVLLASARLPARRPCAHARPATPFLIPPSPRAEPGSGR